MTRPGRLVTSLALLLPPLACGDDASSASATADGSGTDTAATETNPTTSASSADTSGSMSGTMSTTMSTTDSATSESGTTADTSGTDSSPTTGSSGDPTSSTDSASATDASSSTDGSSSSGAVSASMSGSSSESTGNDTQGICPFQCAADLQAVIDCNGEQVDPCDEDEGCFDAECIPDPCNAADLAESSVGCDYWAIKTDLIAEGSGACFAAFVANTWQGPAFLEVEYEGMQLDPEDFIRIPQGQGLGLVYQPYDAMVGLAPGEVAILFLSRGVGNLPDCPSPAALDTDTQVIGTGVGSAFNIRSDRPVIAYQMLPYGGGSVAATSATLLLPTSVWDTNYMAINAYSKSQVVGPAQPSLNIVAQEDNTQVTILPVTNIVGGAGVAAGPANMPAVYTIDRGEHLQLSQDVELTGSPIMTSAPVGFFGAASCLNVPVNAAACDSAHQQIPPVSALGSSYAAVRYRNRSLAVGDEAPPWRIVGLVDNTTLDWDPAQPPGAPASIDQGEVVEFADEGEWVVTSQDVDHPFYVAAYMTGGQDFGGEGDPEWVNVVPVDQYLSRYVFFTDPTFSETSLVVVRRPDEDGMFQDVDLDCAGTLGNWQALGPYEFTRIDLVTGNFQDVGACSNGRHEMTSDAPFGVTVWGWGNLAFPFTQYVSYAYPAGLSLAQINDVVIIPQ